MEHKIIKDLPNKELADGVVMRSAYLKNVMVTFVDLAQDSVVPLHSHPHEQISVIISGRMKFSVDGEEREVGPGEVVLVPSDAEHGVEVTEGPAVAYDCWSPVREDYILD
jgi:unsaturated pyranuronate lyase